MSFEIFTPILSYLNENEKKNRKKSKILYFEKQNKKRSGDMVDRYLSVKFGVIPLGGFRENDVYGRTDDGRTSA